MSEDHGFFHYAMTSVAFEKQDVTEKVHQIKDVIDASLSYRKICASVKRDEKKPRVA